MYQSVNIVFSQVRVGTFCSAKRFLSSYHVLLNKNPLTFTFLCREFVSSLRIIKKKSTQIVVHFHCEIVPVLKPCFNIQTDEIHQFQYSVLVGHKTGTKLELNKFR